MVEVMKIMATSFKKSHVCIATLGAPSSAAGHHQPTPPLETPGKSGSVFCGVTVPFSWVLVHISVCLCPPRGYFLVLCKFWQLCGGVTGDLLQEGLCHTQVCCTQSPCPCGRPLPTCTSAEDTQTQPVSICGVSGSWCTQGSSEPSERLWQERSLILNANLPLLPSCWGFSFALGHGVSP